MTQLRVYAAEWNDVPLDDSDFPLEGPPIRWLNELGDDWWVHTEMVPYDPPSMYVDSDPNVDWNAIATEIETLAANGEVDACTLMQARLFRFARTLTDEQNCFAYSNERWHRLRTHQEREEEFLSQCTFSGGRYFMRTADARQRYRLQQEDAAANQTHDESFRIRTEAIRNLILCVDPANFDLLNPLEDLLFGTHLGQDNALGQFVNRFHEYTCDYRFSPSSILQSFWSERRIDATWNTHPHTARFLVEMRAVEESNTSSTTNGVDESCNVPNNLINTEGNQAPITSTPSRQTTPEIQGHNPGDIPQNEAQTKLPNGPYGPDGFRYLGKEVRFGRASYQYRLLLAFWDAGHSRVIPCREVEDVINDVYGHDSETSDEAFRKMCSSTNQRLERDSISLRIERPSPGQIRVREL